MAGHTFVFEGPDDPLGRHDLAIFAPEPVFVVAVRPAVEEAILATRPEVQLADGQRVLPGAPPLRQVLALAVRLEDEFAWGVEDARHNDLPIRRGRQR